MKKIISIVSVCALPFFALAQGTVIDAQTLFAEVNTILNSILPIIISIAIIWFVYNAFIYMVAADEEKKGEAKSKMIYGLIAIFVMVSVWGLVNVLKGTFNLNNGTIPPPILLR
ncbi:MAG: hypothetical protein KGJ58_00795 [Patescibacteria group bacterium]|nr:hypothetical protein [Patescibacteria group bacterium]MDE1988161.1 hypothetical protein [Patescibacteria group bacterium]MDE2217981.1 hypothetical protein [Patescibacteria group bacterium]